MKKTLLTAVFLILISEGLGLRFLKLLKTERKGFAAPLGFAVLLSLLQLCYYPAQLMNLSFSWIVIPSAIVLGAGLVNALLLWRDLLASLKRKDTLIILCAACAFLFVFSRMYIDLDYSDSATYLNYIAMNINAPSLNMFNLTNGLRGEEWDLYYLFQGYYHFASFLCWLINVPYYLLGSQGYVSNMVIVIWGMGLVYNVLTSMLIVNIVRSMKLKDRLFEYALLAFGLFYTNFFYWNTAFAFYGNTYRNLFVVMIIYVLYAYMRGNNENLKYLVLPVTAAGLACSSSYLFMVFAVLYSFAAHIFLIHKQDALRDMMTMIIPMVVYVCAFFGRSHAALGIAVFLVYGLIILFRDRKPLVSVVHRMDSFFSRYAVLIFFIGIPAIFAAGSFAMDRMHHDYLINYGYYFTSFRQIDMITDYLFIHADWLEKVIDVLRWAGVVLIIWKAESREDRWIRTLMIILLVFFLNPLCTIMLCNTITGMVFYRNFMTLFNPMSETLIMIYLYRAAGERKAFRYGLSGILASAVLLGNIGSFLQDSGTGIYWVYISGGKEVDHIYKIDTDEHQAILAMKDYIDQDGDDSQPVIVAQTGAALTYIPEAYLVFSPREHFYENTRVNEEFYQIARRHLAWEENTEPDYSHTCGYLREYNVDYVMVQYWENKEFDQAADACTVTLLTGAKYKVKQVIGEE